MNLMCHVITPYICTVCGEDTLFFVTKNNRLIDYRYMIRSGMTLDQIENYLKERGVNRIKCINCNKEYPMDFRKRYPTNINTTDLLGLLNKQEESTE